MKDKILVLLSTYNGEVYLEELLESVLNQKNVKLDILIRDDGSTDQTVSIIKKYAYEYSNVEYYIGKNIGYAKSFWDLIKKSNEYDYYAFCDQDDVWMENKLNNAIKLLDKNKKNIPLLYTSNVIPVNEKLKKIKKNSFKKNEVLNVYESFQKSILPGCTFVFNKFARNIAIKYQGYIESHDWALYNIVNVFGEVIFDNNSQIKYRIYNGNTIGQKSKMIELIGKIKRFFRKSKCTRSRFALDFYETYKMTIPTKYKNDIYNLGYYKYNIKNKISLLFSRKFKGLIFKIYVLLNRI